MIVWLNGPFGVGKSSTAAQLASLLPKARFVDPERLGGVLHFTIGWLRPGDFQNLWVWRRGTVLLTRWAARRGTVVVVPMSVLRPSVLDELMRGLRRHGHAVHHVHWTRPPTFSEPGSHPTSTPSWPPTSCDVWATASPRNRTTPPSPPPGPHPPRRHPHHQHQHSTAPITTTTAAAHGTPPAQTRQTIHKRHHVCHPVQGAAMGSRAVWRSVSGVRLRLVATCCRCHGRRGRRPAPLCRAARRE